MNHQSHPFLIDNRGNPVAYHHGKAFLYQDEEITLVGNISLFSGLGPAWFTTDHQQALEYGSRPKDKSPGDDGLLKFEGLDIHHPFTVEQGPEDVVRKRQHMHILSRISRFYRGSRQTFQEGIFHQVWDKQNEREEPLDWEEVQRDVVQYLQETGVTHIRGKRTGPKYPVEHPRFRKEQYLRDFLMQARNLAKESAKEIDGRSCQSQLDKLIPELKQELKQNGIPYHPAYEGEILRLGLTARGYDGVWMKNISDTAELAGGDQINWLIPFAPHQILLQRKAA